MLIINNRFLSLYDYNFLLVIERIFSAMDKTVVSMAELFYHMKVKNVIIDFLLVIQIIGSTKCHKHFGTNYILYY